MGTISFIAIIALVAAPFAIWVVIKLRPDPPGVFLDTTSPEWQEAVAKAQASIPSLREIFRSGQYLVGVKYALLNSRGDREHVWGELLELSEDSLLATIDTPLRRGHPTSAPPFRTSLSDLEDWQVQLPDGAIRGGFTTRLDIKVAREKGLQLPAHMLAMEGRFVDA
jgi:hypothetical protein